MAGPGVFGVAFVGDVDAWTADGVLEGYQKVRAGGASEVTGDIARVTGHPALDFATWAQQNAARFDATRA